MKASWLRNWGNKKWEVALERPVANLSTERKKLQENFKRYEALIPKTKDKKEPVPELIRKMLKENTEFLLLEGQIGFGKTLTLQYIFHQFAKQRKVNLAFLYAKYDLKDQIKQVCEQLKGKKNAILFIDGLDEDPFFRNYAPNERPTYLAECLEPLHDALDVVQVVASVRSELFELKKERPKKLRSLKDVHTVTMDYLDRLDVTIFLDKQRLGATNLYERVRKVEEFRRPLILMYLLDLKVAIDNLDDFYIYDLFEKFTMRWAEMQMKRDTKATAQLEGEVKELATLHHTQGKRLAFFMHRHGCESFKAAELKKWLDDGISIDHSFFVREQDDAFSFAHRGFMEYFLALCIYEGFIPEDAEEKDKEAIRESEFSKDDSTLRRFEEVLIRKALKRKIGESPNSPEVFFEEKRLAFFTKARELGLRKEAQLEGIPLTRKMLMDLETGEVRWLYQLFERLNAKDAENLPFLPRFLQLKKEKYQSLTPQDLQPKSPLRHLLLELALSKTLDQQGKNWRKGQNTVYLRAFVQQDPNGNGELQLGKLLDELYAQNPRAEVHHRRNVRALKLDGLPLADWDWQTKFPQLTTLSVVAATSRVSAVNEWATKVTLTNLSSPEEPQALDSLRRLVLRGFGKEFGGDYIDPTAETLAPLKALYLHGHTLPEDSLFAQTFKDKDENFNALPFLRFVLGLVRVRAGTFTMGDGSDFDNPSHEVEIDNPPHEVEITQDFFLQRFTVTYADFKAFMEAESYTTDAEKGSFLPNYYEIRDKLQGLEKGERYNKWLELLAEQEKESKYHRKGSYVPITEDAANKGKSADEIAHRENASWRTDAWGEFLPHDTTPVVHVSWNDATKYCEWMKKVTGLDVQLPTETQWEFAAGGGAEHPRTAFAGTSEEAKLKDYAWFRENMPGVTHDNDKPEVVRPVGQKLPNALQLYDMSGNVWEWCADGYAPDYYANSPSHDPTGPEESSTRVLRGGSWSNVAQACHVAYRYHYAATNRNFNNGFRCAVSPQVRVPISALPKKE